MLAAAALTGDTDPMHSPRRNPHPAAADTSHAFAQQIAAFYPYSSPPPPRADDALRNDSTRGPEPVARHSGLPQRRHGRGAG